mgnify:CR=1 FL=1
MASPEFIAQTMVELQRLGARPVWDNTHGTIRLADGDLPTLSPLPGSKIHQQAVPAQRPVRAQHEELLPDAFEDSAAEHRLTKAAMEPIRDIHGDYLDRRGTPHRLWLCGRGARFHSYAVIRYVPVSYTHLTLPTKA